VNFRFSAKITLTTLILAAGMVWASFWQWGRHLDKQQLIKRLDETLLLEPIELSNLLDTTHVWNTLNFRRVKVSGRYDFEHEFLLRNRNLEGRKGFHVITPLRIDGRAEHVLVDRGFLPWGRESREDRVKYQTPTHVELYGLVKESVPPKFFEFFAPKDPEAGPDKPWVDQWLRVAIPKIQKQLPYAVLPIYLEVMQDPNDPLLPSKIVREGAGGRNDVLAYTGQKNIENYGMDSPDLAYPIPTYDTTPPPDIHLGYVYEWAFMAFLTLGIGSVMQFKRSRKDPSTDLSGPMRNATTEKNPT
jgi:surfeit locus 1 family protein